MAKPERVNRMQLGFLMTAVGAMQLWLRHPVLGCACIAVGAVLIGQHLWLKRKSPHA
jgi:hypothetical protein